MFFKVEQKWGIDFNAFLQKLEFTFLRGLIQGEGAKNIKASQVNADL